MVKNRIADWNTKLSRIFNCLMNLNSSFSSKLDNTLVAFPIVFFQLEKGVDGLFDSFARLDSRISSVGQTAAKIGDHLQV